MTFIPRTTIDAIMQLNAAEVIGYYVTLKHSFGSAFTGLCPFHKEKTPSFSVSPGRSAFKCFGCGKGGSVIQFVMDHLHVDFPSAAKIIADRFNIPIDAPTGNIRREEIASLDDAKEFSYIPTPLTRDNLRGIISKAIWDSQDEAAIIHTCGEYGFAGLAEYTFTKKGKDDKDDERGKFFKVTIKSTASQPCFMFKGEE